MKPVLVGEDNPHSADPARVLWPEPRGASGDRLRRILGLTVEEYLEQFDRVNLCVQAWDLSRARVEATRLLWVCERERAPLVLLGRRVARAFGVPDVPLFSRPFSGLPITLLPHPSGRSKVWNNREAHRRARRAVRGMILFCDRRGGLSATRQDAREGRAA